MHVMAFPYHIKGDLPVIWKKKASYANQMATMELLMQRDTHSSHSPVTHPITRQPLWDGGKTGQVGPITFQLFVYVGYSLLFNHAWESARKDDIVNHPDELDLARNSVATPGSMKEGQNRTGSLWEGHWVDCTEMWKPLFLTHKPGRHLQRKKTKGKGAGVSKLHLTHLCGGSTWLLAACGTGKTLL